MYWFDFFAWKLNGQTQWVRMGRAGPGDPWCAPFLLWGRTLFFSILWEIEMPRPTFQKGCLWLSNEITRVNIFWKWLGLKKCKECLPPLMWHGCFFDMHTKKLRLCFRCFWWRSHTDYVWGPSNCFLLPSHFYKKLTPGTPSTFVACQLWIFGLTS